MKTLLLPRMASRWTLLIALLSALVLLSACAGPRLADHSGQTPVFDFKRYFSGRVLAHGLVSDRGGKVLRRFVVDIQANWAGNTGTLDERFVYDDGERQRRVWTVQIQPDGSLVGNAADVVGQAVGRSTGPAFNWRYTLALPVDGTVYEVQFDDWMYQVDEDVVLNRATMSKFGVRVGEVLLSFQRR
ncbi:DUF3833 domain-containing protein [Piscinibacter sakaiensis]|uniref:DUF3833 domain-containing protein n=1 Tax=Piscinibacter sakaiensis TaxID=1547922 RepID=UPI003AAE9EAA